MKFDLKDGCCAKCIESRQHHLFDKRLAFESPVPQRIAAVKESMNWNVKAGKTWRSPELLRKFWVLKPER